MNHERFRKREDLMKYIRAILLNYGHQSFRTSDNCFFLKRLVFVKIVIEGIFVIQRVNFCGGRKFSIERKKIVLRTSLVEV